MGNKLKKPNNDTRILTEKQINLLLQTTPFNLHQIQEWHRSFLNDCPTGELNQKNFIKVYNQIYPNGKAEKFCSLIFNVFDMDHSGKIDFTEFLIAISLTSENDIKKKLHLAFQVYDADKNGQIDKKEMKNAITSINELFGRKNKKETDDLMRKINDIFNLADKDHSNTVSEEEFVEACLADPGLMKLLCSST